MPMYALGAIPLIDCLDGSSVHQIWYADDATACGGLKELRSWWDKLASVGLDYGYFPNHVLLWRKERMMQQFLLFRGLASL